MNRLGLVLDLVTFGILMLEAAKKHPGRLQQVRYGGRVLKVNIYARGVKA